MLPTDITHRRVLAIALPIVLSNATTPLLGAVDTAVIGQLGQAAPIGAVGLGAVILTTVYWVFGFLRMGTTGLVAQARGAHETPEIGALLMRGLLIAAAAGLALILLQPLLFAGAFRIAPASAEVETLARQYLAIRIWGAPATIAGYAITGWLIATERARAVFALQLATNGLNAALSFGFVLGLGWGVQGVAAATLIAETLGLLFGLWLCRAALAQRPWADRARLLDPARLRRMAAVNTDILIRSVVLQASFTAFVFLGAGFGDVTLAANQVLLIFLQITAGALDGFAFAAEALVGQAMGARARAALRRGALVSSQWAYGGAAILTLVFGLGGGALIDVMTAAPEVRAEARLYLPWLAASPLLAIGCFMLDGIFIGATRTRDMRNAALASVAIYALSLMALIPLIGPHGLWAGLAVMYVARTVTLARRYPALEAAAAR
jgi:MATE family multidrug resistance protein